MDGCSPQLRLRNLAGSRNQTGDVYYQSSFGYSGEARELNSHAYIHNGVSDNPLKRDVLVPSSQSERNFRSSRKRVRVEDKNALQA
jgi:hypothetical protein